MRKLTTERGYDFFEVASAFQKSIRRGEEENALYWMVELFNSNYDEYCWKRLRIIGSEDVGLAEPTMPATIQALYANFKEQKKKKDDKNRPERLFLTHAVLLLCRAKKSRLVDNALIYFWNSHYGERKPIPDYAYDKHNQKGRSANRGWKHFFEEGTKLENHIEQPKEADYKKGAEQYAPNPIPKPSDEDSGSARQGSFWML